MIWRNPVSIPQKYAILVAILVFNHKGFNFITIKKSYFNSLALSLVKTCITLLLTPNNFRDMAKSSFNTTDGSHLGFSASIPRLTCLPCFKLILRVHRTHFKCNLLCEKSASGTLSQVPYYTGEKCRCRIKMLPYKFAPLVCKQITGSLVCAGAIF